MQLKELCFLPPLAIARLGGADEPLDCFHWAESSDLRGAGRTVIEPAVSLNMAPDGTLSAHMPTAIHFRDRARRLRPVAPFFELWARIDDESELKPLTLDLLEELRVGPEDLRFEISVANKKAQRRTLDPACGFIARELAHGTDHGRKALLASSPHDATGIPLVRHDRPIPLGTFQVARAERKEEHGVDLSRIRVRYTPPKGEVYGPPLAVAAMASPLPEGQNMVWAKMMQGRVHEMVKAENRILNPDSAWSKYTLDAPGQVDPQPNDSYDGAKNGRQLSWGVVDDTCDGVIQAHLVISGERFSAFARVTASPPDYAPDRRMFYSVADDLADRDLPPPLPITDVTRQATEYEVVDLMTRVFETASQINLDAERHHYVCRKKVESAEPPHFDGRSMTPEDTPYAKRSAVGMIDETQANKKADVATAKLQYTKLAEEVHEGLMQRIPLLSLLATDAERVRKLIRPPFGRVKQLPADAQEAPAAGFRDPRNKSHLHHDMRMPPYMLDSDANPLSLSWRQYQLLMALVEKLAPSDQARASTEAVEPAVLRRSAIERIGKVDRILSRTRPKRKKA